MSLVVLGASLAFAQEVRVAAASSVRYALDEIIAAYSAEYPEVGVSVSYGSSGTFYAELLHGAPYDLFLGADDFYTAELERAGRAEAGTRSAYALGRLIVWAHGRLGFADEAAAAEILGSPAVRHIAIANPAHAPYGRAGIDLLTNLGLLAHVEGKLLRGENVAQAAQIALQSGGVGIFASSLATASHLARSGRIFELPADSHEPLRHESVILAGRGSAPVRSFQAFLTGPAAQEILARHGLESPRGAPPGD